MRVAACLEDPPPRTGEELKPAAQRETEQQRGPGERLEYAEARLRYGVAGRLLVRRERNVLRKLRGNGIAAGGDVLDVPPRKPHAHRGGERERDEKNSGEPMHWAKVGYATMPFYTAVPEKAAWRRTRTTLSGWTWR